jgi:hypothetical protein
MRTQVQNTMPLPLAGNRARAGAWLFVLAFVVPAVLVGVVLAMTAAAKPLAGTGFAVPAIVLAVCAGGWLWLRRLVARVGVRLAGDALHVDGGVARRDFLLSSLARGGLEIVDLDQRTELKPMLRTWGIGLPGLQAGWFRLRNGDKAFCVLGGRRRVSALKADDGTRVLLSLADPRPLREALEHLARHQPVPHA